MVDKTDFHPKLAVEGEDPQAATLTKAELYAKEDAEGKLEKSEVRVWLQNDWYDGQKHWEKGIRVMTLADTGPVKDHKGEYLPSTAYVLDKNESTSDVLQAKAKRRFADAKPVPGSDGKPTTRAELGGRTSFVDEAVKQTAKK